jgi:hypothetical protein
MPRKGRSNEEIVHALGQVESGKKVTEVCRPSVSASKRSIDGRSSSPAWVLELRELRPSARRTGS